MEQKLKRTLELFELEDEITDELLLCMLENIGTLDSELRDDYIFETFYVFFNNDLLKGNQKQLILDICRDRDLLKYGLEKGISDDVYTRSFTALLLVELLNNHYRTPWIKEEEEKDLVAYCLDYLLTEHDRSGKDPIKGWSHAFAHGSDLLGALSKSKYFNENETETALKIMDRAFIDVEGFLYGEEGRFARATLNMMKNDKLSNQYLIAWIQSKDEYIMSLQEFKVNWKNYLLTLSYTLSLESLLGDDLDSVINNSLSLFYNRFKKL